MSTFVARFRKRVFGVFRCSLSLGVLLSANVFGAEKPFFQEGASVHVAVSQRFFSDPSLGRVNGASEWGAWHFRSEFGLYKMPLGFEPLVSVGFMKNSGDQITAGAVTGKKIPYQIFSSGAGIRWKPWSREFFWIEPYVQTLILAHYAKLREQDSTTKGPLGQRLEWGGELGAGVFISFLEDAELRNQMESEWSATDYGLVSSVRYLPGGLLKKGSSALVSELSGWDFGLGLMAYW